MEVLPVDFSSIIQLAADFSKTKHSMLTHTTKSTGTSTSVSPVELWLLLSISLSCGAFSSDWCCVGTNSRYKYYEPPSLLHRLLLLLIFKHLSFHCLNQPPKQSQNIQLIRSCQPKPKKKNFTASPFM